MASCMAGKFSQRPHTAIAHSPIGRPWASYAGSARPFLPSSASTSARSRFCPPVPAPGAVMAATVCLCALSSQSGTPVMALPYVIARMPVRTSLAVLTPTLRSRRNRGSRLRYFSNLSRSTTIFLRTPAPSPAPSALTRSLYWMLTPLSAHRSHSSSPRLLRDAVHSDLVLESSCPVATTKPAMCSMNPPSC